MNSKIANIIALEQVLPTSTRIAQAFGQGLFALLKSTATRVSNFNVFEFYFQTEPQAPIGHKR